MTGSVCPFCGSEEKNRYSGVLQSLKISVVMPVYNEKDTILEIIKRVHEIPLNKELIIVDDGSTDGTAEILRKIPGRDAKIFFHDKNLGKGAACFTGFKNASGDVIVIQDADLEYDPRDYGKLLLPIADGRADVVYGSRFIGEPHRVLLFWHYVGNKLLTGLLNILCNINLTDSTTCYKAFRKDILSRLEFSSNRFGFETEFTVKVSRLGCRIYETAISYSARNYDSGKKITWKDGIKSVMQAFKYALFSGLK